MLEAGREKKDEDKRSLSRFGHCARETELQADSACSKVAACDYQTYILASSKFSHQRKINYI